MKTNINLRDMMLAGVFAAILSVSAIFKIPLPFSPVPITLQSFIVILMGLTLTTLPAMLGVTTYILLGLIGLPVFAGGNYGPGALLGKSGGYIIGFLAAVIVITLIRNNSNNILRMSIAGFTGGILTVYTIGMLWLSHVAHLTLGEAFVPGVLLFIPGDLFKLFAAVVVAGAVNRQLARQNVGRATYENLD
ncbi:MAG TPA: biotin transporter BioY [Clostridia bacterium]